MASCLTDIHVWSLKNQTIIPDQDIACYSYHDKQETDGVDHPYLEEKAQFTEGRNTTWAPRNKRPEKLKDMLKELEELLGAHRCVACRWISHQLIQLMLRNGTLVSLVVSPHTGDVDRILIDKSLVGKLASDNPCDALWTDTFLVLCYPDKPKLDYVYFTKKHDAKKLEKISGSDPKIVPADIPGPVGRKLERKLTCNANQDVIVCWWSMATEEAWPWSPMTADNERANMVLFSVTQSSLDLLAHTRTDCDPVGVSYSKLSPHQLFTMEQSTGANGEVNIDSCVYECTRNKLHRLAVTTIALQSGVTCQDRSVTEDKVLLGCEDSTIVLYDEFRKLTQMTTAAIVPRKVLWHPSGTLLVVANSRCQLQIFDMALSPLLIQTVAENPMPNKTLNLSAYFRTQPMFGHMMWSPVWEPPHNLLPECNHSIFLAFDREPLVMIQFYLGVMGQGHLSPLTLVNQYIRYRQIDEAINLLSGLNWNMEGKTCYACLSAIANHLLRGSLNARVEAQLEATLGAFYAPARPINEVSVMEFRDQISYMARRFFHLLLRFTRFEKAFLLAVDIGSRDLFMDLHHLASDRGELALAEVARRKANKVCQLPDQEEDEAVSATESEGSLEESYSGSEEEYIEGAPPLPPRMFVGAPLLGKPLPQLPTQQSQNLQVMTRSHDQHEPEAVHDGRTADGPYMDMSQRLLESLDADVVTAMPSELKEFMEENILPPPPSHADGDTESPRSSKLKVIHFGIV